MDDNQVRLKDNFLKVNISENLSSPNPSKIEPSSFKRYSMQAYIFVLTFFTYAVLHISRESWAFLKDKVDKDDEEGINLSSDELGTIDMVFLIFYSIGLYASGILGYNFNKKLLIGFGYLLVCGA